MWNKVLPVPRDINLKEGSLRLDQKLTIELVGNCGGAEFSAAIMLKEELIKIGVDADITKVIQGKECGNIRLYLNDKEDLKNKYKIDNPEEAYILEVNPQFISIKGETSKGIFYGIQTLIQGLNMGNGELKCAEVIDYPEFKVRGFYHDITRGKVATLDKLKKIVDDISKYKINQFQLYVEHVFPFKGHEEIWKDKDPITPEEILELDEYCIDRHVEMVPSLACFGHLYHLLSSGKFSHLCELENSSNKDFSWVDRMGHHTIDITNNESIELIRSMIEEYLPLFKSDKFNICCDETFDLGKGRSKKYVDEVGKGRAYVDFLNKLIKIVKKHGKTPMFWGDIILNHPELLKEVDDEVICLNWNYSPQATDESTKVFKESGRPFYNCPAVWGWDKFMNDIEGSFNNIKRMARYSKEYGAQGMLCTDWGDYGHVNWYAASKPGMIYSAALSWNTDIEMSLCKSLISSAEYKDESMLNLMEELGKQQYISFMEIVWWMENKCERTDLLVRRPELIEKYLMNKDESKLKESYIRALEIGGELSSKLSQPHIKNKEDIKKFVVSAKVIALLNSLYLHVKNRDYSEKVESQIHETHDLAYEIEKWLVQFKASWRTCNKESELYRVEEFFNLVCDYLRK